MELYFYEGASQLHAIGCGITLIAVDFPRRRHLNLIRTEVVLF